MSTKEDEDYAALVQAVGEKAANQARQTDLAEKENETEAEDAALTILAAAKTNDLRQMISVFNALINITDENGWSPCHYAAKHTNTGMLDLLNAGSHLQLKDSIIDCFNDPSLSVAFKGRTSQNSQTTRDSNVSTGQPTNQPTDNAPIDERPAKAEMDNAGEDASIQDFLTSEDGTDPKNKNSKWVLNINAQTTQEAFSMVAGSTALHIAASTLQPQVIFELLARGADAKVKDESERTALWVVLEKAKGAGSDLKRVKECVEMLIHHGADPNETQSDTGLTVLMVLAKIGCAPALKVLLKVLTDEWTTEQCHDTSRQLMAGRVAINSKCNQGFTGLHYASQAASVECVLELLEYGAMPNCRDKRNNTPLHYAATLALAHFLVSNGARLDMKNDQNIRAIARYDDKGSTKAFNEAVDTYAHVSMVDGLGKKSPLPSGSKSWFGDDTSTMCLACSVKFSMITRRHHCRMCGLLVCATCSKKTFKCTHTNNESLRTCDGCHNILKRLNREEKLEKAKIQAKESEENERMEAEREEASRASKCAVEAMEEDQKRQLQAAATNSASMNTPSLEDDEPQSDRRKSKMLTTRGRVKHTTNETQAQEQTSQVAAQMAQNNAMLAERGEKLEETADAADRLNDQAADFLAMATAIRKNAENPARKSGWF